MSTVDVPLVYVDNPSHTQRMSDVLINRIQERLDVTGKSARAVSIEAGLNSDAIRNIFRGISKNPGFDVVIAMAKQLECSPLYLVGEIDTLYPVAVTADQERLLKHRNRNILWNIGYAVAETRLVKGLDPKQFAVLVTDMFDQISETVDASESDEVLAEETKKVVVLHASRVKS